MDIPLCLTSEEACAAVVACREIAAKYQVEKRCQEPFSARRRSTGCQDRFEKDGRDRFGRWCARTLPAG